MNDMTFEQFKAECLRACHLRHSCEEGLSGVVHAQNTLQLLTVVKTFWKDVYESKYYDIVAERLQDWYGLKDEFNRQGIYVNEPVSRGIVMVNNYGYGNPNEQTEPFVCGGNSDIYIFGKSDADVRGNARIHCRTAGSHIRLYNSSQGDIKAGSVEVHGYATAICSTLEQVNCYGASTVRLLSGMLYDHGHKHIYAYGDSIVMSDSPQGITLYNNAKIIKVNCSDEMINTDK